MPWLSLFVAGIFGDHLGRRTQIHARLHALVAHVLTGAAMVASLYFLGQTLKTIPIGTGYAVWTGIGTAALGIVLFAESSSLSRLPRIARVVAGIMGLKRTAPE